jgi:hypothetical protein
LPLTLLDEGASKLSRFTILCRTAMRTDCLIARRILHHDAGRAWVTHLHHGAVQQR